MAVDLTLFIVILVFLLVMLLAVQIQITQLHRDFEEIRDRLDVLLGRRREDDSAG